MKPFGLDKCFHVNGNKKYWYLIVIQHMLLELSKNCCISYVKTCGTVAHEISLKSQKFCHINSKYCKRKQYLKNSIMTDYLLVWNRTWWGSFWVFRVRVSEMQRVSTLDLGRMLSMRIAHIYMTTLIVFRCSKFVFHDYIMTWKCFLCYCPFERGIHRWPVDSTYKGPVMLWSFGVFLSVRPNRQLNNQWSCRWLETKL